MLFLLFLVSYSQAQVAAYSFSQAGGTYCEISGGTVIATQTSSSGSGSLDDVTYNLPSGTIPFTFNYNGIGYTGLNVNSNGFITFGTTSPVGNTYTPISSTTGYAGAVAAFGRDLQGGYATTGTTTSGSNVITNAVNTTFMVVGSTISGTGIPAGTTVTDVTANTITISANATSTGTNRTVYCWSGNISYATEGSSPYQTFVIQWKNFRSYNGVNTHIDFQIRLNEDGNTIDFVYNNALANTSNISSQVGLRGAANADFKNLTGTNWSSPGMGLANNNTMTYSTTATLPPNGQTYTWTPLPPASIDMGAIALVSPSAPGCYGNEPVVITIKNFSFQTIDFSMDPVMVTCNVTGDAVQTLSAILNSGSLTPDATVDVMVGALDMSAGGTFTFNANTMVTGDGNSFNDAMLAVTKVVPLSVSVPNSVNFTGFTGSNLATLFPGWSEATGETPTGTTSIWSSSTIIPGSDGRTAKINLYTNTRKEWIISPVFMPGSQDGLELKAAITNYNSAAPDPDGMAPDDKVQVMISTDCGSTWSSLYVFDRSNTYPNLTNVLTPYYFPLGAYAGQNVRIAFYATDGPVNDLNDYDFHIDNIGILPFSYWYEDVDADGYGNPDVSVFAGTPPAGYVADNSDCDDGAATTYPGATELCNGIDDNCDGTIDDGIFYYGNVTLTSQAQVDAWLACYTGIIGNLTILNGLINDLSPLMNLQSVSGSISIQYTSITSLNGLNNLASVGQNVMINYNSQLTTTAGLNNLSSVGMNFLLMFNTKLSDCCAVQDLVNETNGSNVGGLINVFGNKTGCENVAGINAACTNPIIVPPTGNDVLVANTWKQGITVFPNPASSEVNVMINSDFTTGSLRLLDLQGRVLHQQELEGGAMSNQIGLDQLPGGTYFVVTILDGEVFTEKLSVK